MMKFYKDIGLLFLSHIDVICVVKKTIEITAIYRNVP